MKVTYRSMRYSAAFITLFIFTAGVACSGKSGEVISKKQAQKGKVAAPISISYTVPSEAAVGKKITVKVEFTTLSDVDELRLELTAGESLDLISGNTEAEYGNQPSNSTFSESITVMPITEGILYLNVFVSGIFEGKTMVRSGAVPINTGSDKSKMLKTPGFTTTDSEGQKVIIMEPKE